MDYVAFCKNYYAATRIPTTLMNKERSLYSTVSEMLSLAPAEVYEIAPCEENPIFCGYSPEIEYGRIWLEGTDCAVILGPIFGVKLTNDLINKYMRENAIALEHKERLTEFLYTIPTISHMQFAKHLALIHQCLNNQPCDVQQLINRNRLLPKGEDKPITVAQRNPMPEDGTEHNTYYHELELYEKIKMGNPTALREFLEMIPLNMNEKRLAKSPLRQAKNLFINIATNVVMIGGIPGGMDVEQAYQLMDVYVQDCENCQTVEEIEALQYRMMMDFCRRVGECKIPQAQIPGGISSDVFACMNYIRSHVNENIGIEDVAAHIRHSASYVTKQFKSELGFTPGVYINRCRLEEAKSLLTFSEKSLADISSYLCYSSQGYFQNVFKKQYGITPMQYRRQSRKIYN